MTRASTSGRLPRVGRQRGRPADAPVLVVRNRRALRRLLWAPGNWAWPGPTSRAISTSRATSPTASAGPGGSLAPGGTAASFGARERVRPERSARRLGARRAPPKPPAVRGAIGRPAAHRDAGIAPRSRTTTTCPTTSTRCCSTSTWRTRRRTSLGHRHAVAARCPDRQVGPHLPQAGPAPGMRLLDVGCGWGSLILHAAQHYGVHATGITLSREQLDLRRGTGRRARSGRSGRGAPAGLPRIGESPDGRGFRRGEFDRDGRARRRRALSAVRGDHVRRAQAGRTATAAADVAAAGHRAGRRCVHRAVHRAGHAHAAAVADPAAISRTAASRCSASRRCASTTCAPANTGWTPSRRRYDEFVALAGEEIGPGVAALPGRGRAGVRGGAHGRRPDSWP